MTKLEKLKKAIYQVCGELIVYIDGNVPEEYTHWGTIELPHVLRAIDAVRPLPREWIAVACDGAFMVTRGNYTVENGKEWDLTEDLDGQSDECIDFLHSLIVKI
jgi:hypothetical protein